ncbi:MAG: hypothetical protein GY833_06100 [Aestuariibacter sp.]|nr:hypothetical protein [Aestuariibacter sp.]
MSLPVIKLGKIRLVPYPTLAVQLLLPIALGVIYLVCKENIEYSQHGLYLYYGGGAPGVKVGSGGGEVGSGGGEVGSGGGEVGSGDGCPVGISIGGASVVGVGIEGSVVGLVAGVGVGGSVGGWVVGVGVGGWVVGVGVEGSVGGWTGDSVSSVLGSVVSVSVDGVSVAVGVNVSVREIDKVGEGFSVRSGARVGRGEDVLAGFDAGNCVTRGRSPVGRQPVRTKKMTVIKLDRVNVTLYRIFDSFCIFVRVDGF